jgi:hypothetical protein
MEAHFKRLTGAELNDSYKKNWHAGAKGWGNFYPYNERGSKYLAQTAAKIGWHKVSAHYLDKMSPNKRVSRAIMWGVVGYLSPAQYRSVGLDYIMEFSSHRTLSEFYLYANRDERKKMMANSKVAYCISYYNPEYIDETND